MGIAAVCALIFVNFAAKDPEIARQLPAFSFIIAVLAACAAVLAAWSASRSLELVRATTRPFLNIATPALAPVVPDAKPAVDMVIHNTGNLPADEVSIVVEVKDKVSQENWLPVESAHASICFPGEHICLSYLSDLSAGGLVGGSMMRVKVDYHYGRRLVGTTCRAFSLSEDGPVGMVFSAVPKEACWT